MAGHQRRHLLGVLEVHLARREAEALGVVEVAEGKSAKVTFDPPVKKAEELGKSKIVAIETSDGRVIRLK